MIDVEHQAIQYCDSLGGDSLGGDSLGGGSGFALRYMVGLLFMSESTSTFLD